MIRMSFEEASTRAIHDPRTLGAEFLGHARRHPRATAVHDFRGTISRIRLAGAALALAPLLELEEGEQNVGVMLPPGQAGALVNLALALDGRTAVNLNHTTGEAQVRRMCDIARVRTIVSSSLYLNKIGEPALPGRVIHAEDLVPRIKKTAVLRQMARVMALPPSRVDKARPAQVAVIVFSSGSESEPKGVQLTHQQILANCDAGMEHLDLCPGQDILASPLPLFHSFGLVPGLWLCLVNAMTIAAQADPRDGSALGALVAASSATLLIGTPTFVRAYMRRIEPEQLATLRFAFVAAEHCPADLRSAFRERYGCALLEAYGCTELAPAVAINTEAATRDMSVGRPLPGIEVFTMDPDTREILPKGETGALVVRSAARMLGYLDRPDLTERAFVHGGYDTGDIGRVDDEGYIFITGRLARFAKIGGEMVPLDTVEDALQAYVDAHCGGDGEVAVAAVPDRRKGERIVVLHTGLDCEPETITAAIEDLPPLFRPRAKDMYAVEAIPILGTGKRDLGALKQLAEQVAAEDASKVPGAVRTIIERVRGHE